MGERKYTEAAAAAAAAGQNQRRIEHNAQATPMYHQVVENSGYQYRASSTTHMGPEPRRTASSGITAVAASRANASAYGQHFDFSHQPRSSTNFQQEQDLRGAGAWAYPNLAEPEPSKTKNPKRRTSSDPSWGLQHFLDEPNKYGPFSK